MSLPGRQTLAVDFDGVIHSYTSDWAGYDQIPDPPTKGCAAALRLLSIEYNIAICSCRAAKPEGLEAIKQYLTRYDIPYNQITAEKPVAEAYIDDRGIQFRGNWKEVIGQLPHTPWNKK